MVSIISCIKYLFFQTQIYFLHPWAAYGWPRMTVLCRLLPAAGINTLICISPFVIFYCFIYYGKEKCVEDEKTTRNGWLKKIKVRSLRLRYCFSKVVPNPLCYQMLSFVAQFRYSYRNQRCPENL